MEDRDSSDYVKSRTQSNTVISGNWISQSVPRQNLQGFLGSSFKSLRTLLQLRFTGEKKKKSYVQLIGRGIKFCKGKQSICNYTYYTMKEHPLDCFSDSLRYHQIQKTPVIILSFNEQIVIPYEFKCFPFGPRGSSGFIYQSPTMLELCLALQVHLHFLPAECKSKYSQWTHPSSAIMRSQFLRNHCTTSFTLNLS